MDIIEAYSFLLFDGLITSLIFPIQTNLVFPAMLFFGGYNLPLIVWITVTGSIIGHSLNFGLGRLIITTSKFKPEGKRAVQFFNFCRENGKIMLLLAWVPIAGSFLSVVVAAAGMKAKVALPIIFLVNLLYYSVLAFIY